MDIGLNVGAKRSWDGASDDEIVETAQIKFKRLLERNQASKFASAVETKEKIRNITLKLVDEHLSFEEILRESEDICSVQCGSHQEKPELYSFSALTVDSCVDLLKGQAAKASCSLDLLAAESLGRRLVTVCSSASKQLLTKCQLESARCVVSVIKHMVASQCFNRVYFTKHLTSKGPCLPLEVVWMLHKDCIISFDTYLACCLQCNETVEMISSGLTALCTSISNKEKQESILSVLLGRLVSFSFLENKAKEGSNNRLDKISQEILDITVEQSDFLSNKKMDECPPQKDDTERFCVLEVVRRLNDIPWAAVKKFFSRQLNVFFMKQTDTDTPALDYQVFCNQKKLTFSALNQTVRTVIEQFLLVFDPLTVMECLKNALFKDQVNVRTVLSFLSSFVVLVKEAASMIEGYVYDLLNASLNNNDIHSLRVAFLMIRQMSLEGGHVFQPYVTWFQSYFGDQGNMKLTNKKSVQFLMKFLSDLVPYEPAEYLKVHILKAPQVPSKLRDIVTDYVSLAKTRLMDLKEPVELMAMYGDSSGTSGTETKSEHTKQLEQASADVEKVVESYEKSGKVPSTVMEASIFRKPYFIGRFLPALLTPRKVPDEPDSRAQLIDVLSKAGKIPKSMLSAYQSACEKMTTEQIEVSSPDDERALSGMEKLISCLDKFTNLIVESLKSTDSSKQSGRISSLLSIISATIQSLTKASNEILMTNQLVEVDIDNLDSNTSTQVVDALLDAFCRTYAAVKKCPSDSLDRLNIYHWVCDFVEMVVSIATLHSSLYCQLWRKTCREGAASNKEDTHGLAVFSCYLCINHATILPVLLKGIYRPAERNFPDVFTICSFVDVLCEHIPLYASRWMEFFLRFSCSYMGHALEVFNMNVTELKASVGRHTAYLSPLMLKKTFYLFHRLNVYGETCFYKPTLPEDLACMVSSLVSLQQFQQLKEKDEKLMFSQWCQWELSMSARDDFLPDTDRRIYHQFRVLDHYLPLGTLEGGCNGCARKACSVIFHALLDSESRCPQEQTDRDVSRNDVISLIQILIPLLPKTGGEGAAHKTGENPCEPWLLEQFHSRLSQLQFKVENSKSKTSENSDLLRVPEIISFIKLAVRLPSYLLFTDALDSVPDVYSIKRVVAFINSNLRPFLSEGCCLPFDVTLYIFKALLTYTRGSTSYSRSPASSQLVSECFNDSPLFFVSLQHYWKQLRHLAAAQSHITCGDLKQAELLFNWKNRIETTQNVSLRELESLDVYVAASCIAVYLRDVNSKVMTLFVEESKSPTEFTRNLAVCLFDCIMADFSRMVLHGHEIEENAVLRDFAWKLLRCFPRTLLVFKMDENCEFKEDLIRLRSLILKEQLITLYPAVFFSFFTNFPSESLREVTRTNGFLEVTLCMYNSFVYLRKECLNGVANKTAVCSPLHLDFCRQVSVFVRDCVLCSPEEQLRGLSKDVISSCTSELRQFLQSQLSRFQERKK